MEYELLKNIVDKQFTTKSNLIDRDDIINDVFLMISETDKELTESEIKELIRKKYFSYFEIYDIKDKKSFDKFEGVSSRGIKEGVSNYKPLNLDLYSYFEKILWKGTVRCGKCNSENCYPSEKNTRSHECRNCGNLFSFTSGTNLMYASDTKLKNLKTVLELMKSGVICEKRLQDTTSLSPNEIRSAYLNSLPSIINGEDIIKPINDVITPAEIVTIPELYEHQKECIEETVKYLQDNDRGQIIHPCGSGKTRTSAEIINRLNYKKVCIVVPSKMLVEQHFNNLRIFNPNYKIYKIHSGTTKDIPNFVKNIISNDTNIIVLITYKSFLRLGDFSDKSGFDLSIFDESHCLVGGYPKKQTSILHFNNLNKCLFITATRVINKNIGIDMDSHLFGGIIHSTTIPKLIEEKILKDYKLLCIEDSTEDTISKEIKDLEHILIKSKVAFPIKKRVVTSVLSLIKALNNDGDIKKIISYHATIKESILFSEVLKFIQVKFGLTIDCYNVNYKMSTKNREDILGKYKLSNRAVICSVNCFQEGVDIKEVDSVFFGYPKRSKIAIVQAFGRCIRKNNNRKGTVIIPYCEKDFSNLREIIQSIKNVDNRFEINSINYDKYLNNLIEFMYLDTTKQKYVDLTMLYLKLKVIKEDYLGILSYEECSNLCKYLNISSEQEYRRTRDISKGMPSNPKIHYKHSWVDWKSFLQIVRKSLSKNKLYAPVSVHRPDIRVKNLSSPNKRRERLTVIKQKDSKKPIRSRKRGKMLEYDEAIRYIKDMNQNIPIKVLSALEYRAWATELTYLGDFPNFLPISPEKYYDNFSWNEFFGTSLRQNKYRDFATIDECKEWAKHNNIQTAIDYVRSDKPDNMPQNARDYYSKRGLWISWDNFFGREEIKKYSYEEHIEYIKQVNIQFRGIINSYTSYRLWSTNRLQNAPKFPKFLYNTPEKPFKGLKWDEFLGKSYTHIRRGLTNFADFDIFLKFLKDNDIKSYSDYPLTKDLPLNIPAYNSLARTYKNQWKGFRYHRKNNEI